MSGGYLSGGICPVGICPVGICPDTITTCISISTHSYRAAFNKRTMFNAVSKLMDTAVWLCNQCFLQSAVVEFGAVICNDFEVVSPNWRK